MSIVIIFEHSSIEPIELMLLDKSVIGRSSKADISINDSKMSARHCSVELVEENIVLFKDLDSTNGSFFNNSKINFLYIKIGDTVIAGETRISIDEKRLSRMERVALTNQDPNAPRPTELSLNPSGGKSTQKPKGYIKFQNKDPAEFIANNPKSNFIEPEDDDSGVNLGLEKKNPKNKKKK
jgi:pSer/pThr/pTyr-binding forkhead associated (FHA) protein